MVIEVRGFIGRRNVLHHRRKVFGDYKDIQKTMLTGNLPPPVEIFRRSENMVFRNFLANVRSTSPNAFDLLAELLKYSDLNL